MQLDAALPILRALADGVDPVSGKIFPDDSPYAQPRILRALYAAANVVEKEITRTEKRQRLPANFGKPWTSADEAEATRLFQAGHSFETIGANLRRTGASVKLRLEKLGLIEPESER